MLLYDASLIAGNVGDLVTTFPDSGIYHFNATNTGGTDRPYLTNNASEINNQRFLYFDNSGSKSFKTNFSTTFPQPTHAFVVAAVPLFSSQTMVLFDNFGTNDSGGLNFGTSGSTTNSGANAGQYIANDGYPTNWTVYEIMFNGTNSFYRTNNALYVYGNAGTNSKIGMVIGKDRTLTSAGSGMKLAYIAYYTNGLTDAEADLENKRLGTKYGVTIATRDTVPTWNPTLISSTLSVYDIGDLKAQAGFVTGTLITSVPDYGPKKYDLIGNGANSAYFISDPKILFGRSYARFDIATSYLQTNYTVVYPQPTTIFLVASNSGTGASTLMTIDNGGDNLVYQALYHQLGTTRINAGTERTYNAALNAWTIFEVKFSGVNSYLKTNGVTALGTGDAGALGRKGITLASDRTKGTHMYGGIAWCGIYTNNLSTTESSNIVYYLGKRFKIPTQ